MPTATRTYVFTFAEPRKPWTVLLGSFTKACVRSAFSSRNFFSLAEHDLVPDGFRLAFFLQLIAPDVPFLFQSRGIGLFRADVGRIQGGSMHCDVARGINVSSFESDDHADLAVAVQVGADDRRLDELHFPEGNIFAEFLYRRRDKFLRDFFRSGLPSLQQRFHDRRADTLKVAVAGDEIRLAFECNDRRNVSGLLQKDESLGLIAAGFFAAVAMPRLRRSSMAFSSSPPASSSAFLHSLMETPVRARSCMTAVAETGIEKMEN